MALDSVKLDDLSWNDMVVAIRRRIAAASDGNWTLHAPVDPGITLLELFAYLLDQRVYWIDQVPDSLVRAALSLLGEQPLPTQAAATVMHFPDVAQTNTLAAATELTLDRSTPPLVFSTHEEVVLLSLRQDGNPISLFINEPDRTPDLEHGKVMRLFPASGPGEVKIVFRLREPLPAVAKDKRVSLLFDLREPAGVDAEWVPQRSPVRTQADDAKEAATITEASAPVSPPANISWSYSGAGGKRIPFADGEVKDGTNGLRRSGVVLLPVNLGTTDQTDWEPEPDGEPFRYAIWLSVTEATFSAPPRVERLVPNVVIASHKRKTDEHALQPDFLPLPHNTLALADLPAGAIAKDHPPIEDTIKLEIREADGHWHLWKPVQDLGFYGPSDRVFIADRLLGKVNFGDGLTGRLPVLHRTKPEVKVQYFVGGGTTGNLGTNLNWETEFDGQIVMAVNVVQTVGGEEPETMEAARQRAATELRRRTRAVIREDYEEIARKIPGVAIKRAHAAIGLHPNHPCVPIPGVVTVFILPDVSRPDVLAEDSPESDGTVVESAFVAAPVPDPGALAAVQAKLESVRLAGSEVFVSAPRYRIVDLTIDVESNSVAATQLSQNIRRRVRRFLDPLVGGDESDGWPFGEPLRPSAILREAQDALGDEGRVTQLFVHWPEADKPNGDASVSSASGCAAHGSATPDENELNDPLQKSTCDDVNIGVHELVALQKLTVNFHRASESQGGLR